MSEVAVDPTPAHVDAPLLAVRDLVVHYPVKRDLAAALHREPHK